MVSAQPQGQLSRCSDDEARIVFRNELTACLALVAPVGMTEESRGEWLAVAWDTLKHLPPDILAIGAKKARQKCDHPAKVVPAIIAETEQMMSWRRQSERWARDEPPVAQIGAEYVKPEEIEQIKREVAEELAASKTART